MIHFACVACVQGVTFACVNAVEVPGDGGAQKTPPGSAGQPDETDAAANKEQAAPAPAAAAGGKLGTFAFRVSVLRRTEHVAMCFMAAQLLHLLTNSHAAMFVVKGAKESSMMH
jgi:hypothetical protein